MAFPVPIASTLTGASVRQLAYWRRETASAPPLLEPAAKVGGRYLYSWADVMALRSIVYLRAEKSLPKIRRAVETLRGLEANEWDHLSQYQLVRTAETIVVRTPKGDLLDLERAPGTVLDEVLMQDVLAPFQTRSGAEVPDFRRPRPHLRVDPAVLGGYPVVVGSRVPFDVVAALADDGAPAADVVRVYPAVKTAEAVSDAQEFAHLVARVA
ncbi:MAG TPA: DUF433 domain-containing protein [Solirubrobacteraceae bacterium]|nr:DUF433 domain-containing protein [Solirubrobacteraceae bacterium]